MKPKAVLPFGWGDTRGVREVLLSVYKNKLDLKNMPLQSFGYPPDKGSPKLISLLSDLTLERTGVRFKHISVTNGCTQALEISLRSLMNSWTESVQTRDLYYPRYPDIIRSVGLIHVRPRENLNLSGHIQIIDSPSNPVGDIHFSSENTDKVIWDAAYNSPTYGIRLQNVALFPEPLVFCGSLSKLTGLNGVRVGWTATNDDNLALKINKQIKTITNGVSYPSQWICEQILEDRKALEVFFAKSRKLVEDNKNEILKLRKIFSTELVSDYGMFSFSASDPSIHKLFDAAGVEFTKGEDCGAWYHSMRLNMANPVEMTAEMVKRIIKQDRKK